MKEYVGARYVPVWKGNHDRLQEYEATDIVTSGVQDYIAIRPVPPGIYINNTLYWKPYGAVTKIFSIAPDTIEIPFYTYYSQATVVMVNKPDVEITYTTTGPINIEVFGNNIIITPYATGLASVTASAEDGQTATCDVEVIDEQFEHLDYLQLNEARVSDTTLGFRFYSTASFEIKFIPETSSNLTLSLPSPSDNQPGWIRFDSSKIKYRYGQNNYYEQELAPYAENGLYTVSLNLPDDVENEYMYKVNDSIVRSANWGYSGNIYALGKNFIGKIFYMKLTDNNTGNVLEELIPARNLADNKIGFMSTITRAFIMYERKL